MNLEVRRGLRAWYVYRESSRNLGDPESPRKLEGLTEQTVRMADDSQEVGSVHSTQGAGEPLTGGRD